MSILNAILCYLAAVAAAAVLGTLLGLGFELLRGEAGWWLVGLLAGAVGGSALAACGSGRGEESLRR